MKRVRTMLLVTSSLLVGFFVGALVTVAHSDLEKANYDQVIAQIGETRITRADLAERLLSTRGKRDLLGLELLRGEFQDRLIIAESARREKIIVTEDEINQRVQDSLAIEIGAKDQPRQQLADRARTILQAEKLLGISATDEEAYNYYKNPNNAMIFVQPEIAKLICVATLKSSEATTALRRIRAGEDAKTISKQFSYDPRLKDMGGDLGWVLGTALPSSVSLEIFGGTRKPPMKPGQATEVMRVDAQNPVPNEKGVYDRRTEYWILYVEDIRPQSMPPFNDVKKIALHYCRMSKFATVYNPWLLKLAADLNDKGQYQQVPDLASPTSELKPARLDISRYSQSTFLAPVAPKD